VQTAVCYGRVSCNVTCTKLHSKYEHLYSSYHVAISVDTADMKRVVDVFMSADVWPCGVFVKIIIIIIINRFV